MVLIVHPLVPLVNHILHSFQSNLSNSFLDVLYGHGVYFDTQARYSHEYASKNNAGERTIFIARVLIGKTCVGDSSMKVPPNGCDTTTDGNHIFVIYHDAGAYAEYLITYKEE